MREVKTITYNVDYGRDRWREFDDVKHAVQFAEKLKAQSCQEEIKIIQHTKILTEENKVLKIIK